jgi:hypothetical protein
MPCGAEEMLILFWLLRRGQVALGPPRVGLALNGIVMEVLTRVSVSLSCPFRLCPVNWANILILATAAASNCSHRNQPKDKQNGVAFHSTRPRR